MNLIIEDINHTTDRKERNNKNNLSNNNLTTNMKSEHNFDTLNLETNPKIIKNIIKNINNETKQHKVLF